MKSLLRNSYIFALVAAILAAQLLPGCKCSGDGEPAGQKDTIELRDTVYPLGFCTDSFDMISGTIRSGENFTSLLLRLGLSNQEAYNLVQASDSVFDVRKLRAGNSWNAYFNADSAEVRHVQYLVYNQDKVNMTVFHCTDSLYAFKVARPVETVRKVADVTINSSLWNDMIAAGVSPLMISELSEIYAWTVDFFGLRKGDRFRVLYDQNMCEGEVIGISGIPYAVFERDGKTLEAVMFDQGDGGNCYWNEKGESMKKAFLKAPLKFTRISSGFTYHRKHPVHGDVRAHTGVDYAAPTGTPVMSIGDGTVISKGWGGGGGNTVKIRHNSVYTTAYLHLSKYANIKVGDRVRQGDVIGYVGMTGTATGPHLDFRVWKNGSPINPLTMESPSAEPIKAENLPALDSVRLKAISALDSLTTLKQ
ncbi:MAG: peptidoglycan DD-metalloendopeptidase family protein [Bacteroidales bacterium]|nr:peptidoglycan DD-metalloendopeptidase family protein [Bacteroidales bacterium]